MTVALIYELTVTGEATIIHMVLQMDHRAGCNSDAWGLRASLRTQAGQTRNRSAAQHGGLCAVSPQRGGMMYEYRFPAIGKLASQMKRGPTRLRLRQLAGIEFLLSVIEAAKSYPFEFIQHTLTGFRPRPGADESDAEGNSLAGEDLRQDLVTLAEDLSATAELDSAHFAESLWGIQEVANRFDVSTKTVFRWHYRGMIGWRIRQADRRFKLVFPDRCIRRFVAENLDLVQRGSSFSQLTAEERDKVLTRAKQLVDAGEKTINAVAKVLSVETGRAVETIRLILKAFDDAHPQRGIFNRSSLKVDADDARLKLWEAYRAGATPERLAEQFDKPLLWVYQAITEMRARDLKSRTIEYVSDPKFEIPGMGQEVLEHSAARSPYAGEVGHRRVPADLPPYLQQLFRIPLLSPEGEYALFRKMNYLRFIAHKQCAALDPGLATPADVDEIERLLGQAAEIKNQITQSNLRLVVSIAKRHVAPGRDFFELVSDGNISLMRAIDKFDFTRGFKFSTYGSWAIMKNFARSVPEERQQRDRFQTGREEYLETVTGPLGEESDNEFIPAVRTTVERMLAALDERERLILRQRFGLDDHGSPATLEQIGQKFGVSKERIRQLEARAIAKLRTDFENDAKSILGP